MTPVSVLLTCDIHTHVTGSEPVKQDLAEARRLLKEAGLRCTFFFPARSAELLRDHVDALREEGHEIGCHGLTHDPSENYSQLPHGVQETLLTEATKRLTEVLGEPPVSFRAPVFKLSPDTIRVLDDLGYRTDLSVTAQRLGVFGSDLYDMKPFFAPRRPYHPALQDPFRRGASRMWEIPVSAWLLPFLSNTERLCGLAFMRWFFRALYLEAKATGKPIVFMFHAEDLNAARGVEGPWRFSWRDFIPSKTFGFQFRHALLERDWQRVQRDLMALFRFMAGFRDVQFLTVREYLPLLDRAPSPQPQVARAVVAGASSATWVASRAPRAERLTGKDILCISSIDWDFIWQGHQEIMATLAAQGNRVLFIENTGVRVPTLRDLPRLQHRLVNWVRSVKGFRQERENLFIYSPLVLPFPYSTIARWINRSLLLRALQRWMRATGFRRPIVWTFLPTPLTVDLLHELDPEITIYYCIDHLASSSPAARRIDHSETRLFRMADVVFVTSEKLRQRAARFNDQVHLFPFGVDFETFERVREGADEIPAELRALPRPVIGYIGGIHRWMDQDLLAAIARAMPHASVVLVGPLQTDVSKLAQHSNIHLLRGRPHAELPRYIKGFDVGIVSYRLSDYTAHVYPTKLNEYLAMGIPVVATDLPEVRRFNAEHGGIVSIARDAGEFVNAVQEALASNSPELVRRRIGVSRQNSWGVRIAQMSALINEAMERRRDEPEAWEQKLRRIYRVTRRRVLKAAVATTLAFLVVFQSPLVRWMAEPLRLVEPARPADAIVVFAGGVGESGKAGQGYQERVKHAVDLYRAGKAPRVIFSSGYTFVFQEAEVMRELAIAHGVPASAISLETHAANTFENVLYVSRMLQQEQRHSILLVSSPFHMRRAVWTFRKVAPSVEVIPSPIPQSQFYADDRGATLQQIKGILHEYLSLLYYWWKGWM
jgi:uncharacterized SAM-binding protein YcdF (DUF218 family)/glycosyltransferase involved in cell wall biosynthesis/peptidoglycan/xylan/chitin deacetylase (PgdA/CDA1 family)